MRIGFGYDVHKLVENRKLIVGGIEIPFEKGLDGHSDADVLTHAIMDALFGAAALGDIGKHFPDTDSQYKDIFSIELLKHAKKILNENNFQINNIDCTIVAEKPKFAPHIPEMKQMYMNILEIEEDKINIKATTTEKLGFTGRKEGIAAYAVCTIIG